MYIKKSLGLGLSTIKTAAFKKTKQSDGEEVEERDLRSLLVWVQASDATTDISVEISQKAKNKATNWSSCTNPVELSKGL